MVSMMAVWTWEWDELGLEAGGEILEAGRTSNEGRDDLLRWTIEWIDDAHAGV